MNCTQIEMFCDFKNSHAYSTGSPPFFPAYIQEGLFRAPDSDKSVTFSIFWDIVSHTDVPRYAI